MEVPGLMGYNYQSLNAPMMNYNMVPQQQAAAAVPEQQTANFYPTMGKNQTFLLINLLSSKTFLKCDEL